MGRSLSFVPFASLMTMVNLPGAWVTAIDIRPPSGKRRIVFPLSSAVAPASVMRKTSPCLTCACANTVIAVATISTSLCKSSQSFENFCGMSGGLHFFEDFGDFAVFSNNESGAFNSHVLLPVHAFFHPVPVSLRHLLLH